MPPNFVRVLTIRIPLIFGPYVDDRQADQVDGCRRIPQITLARLQADNPARPKHKTDDHEGQQGIKGEEQRRAPEERACLGNQAELDGGFSAQQGEGRAQDVQDQVDSRPHHDHPADERQHVVLSELSLAEREDPEQILEYAKGGANGDRQENRRKEDALPGSGGFHR